VFAEAQTIPFWPLLAGDAGSSSPVPKAIIGLGNCSGRQLRVLELKSQDRLTHWTKVELALKKSWHRPDSTGQNSHKFLIDIVAVGVELPHGVAIHDVQVRILARARRKLPDLRSRPRSGSRPRPSFIALFGSNGVIYAVGMSKDSSGNYHQRLHAIDAPTGSELHGGPVEIQAKYPGNGDNSSGGYVIFDPGQYKERAGLLLLNQTVYTAWASHCDFRPYTGWIMGYDASTLAQTTVLNLTPNGNEGAIWGPGPEWRRMVTATSSCSMPTAILILT